jgi:hypothetical protein
LDAESQWQISGKQGWIATARSFAQQSEDKRKSLFYNELN